MDLLKIIDLFSACTGENCANSKKENNFKDFLLSDEIEDLISEMKQPDQTKNQLSAPKQSKKGAFNRRQSFSFGNSNNEFDINALNAVHELIGQDQFSLLERKRTS